jgi:hypothetical protein
MRLSGVIGVSAGEGEDLPLGVLGLAALDRGVAKRVSVRGVEPGDDCSAAVRSASLVSVLGQ